MARGSAERLAELKYEQVGFMHGPEIRDNPRERVREFLRKKGQGAFRG
jgi:hypothetical protein